MKGRERGEEGKGEGERRRDREREREEKGRGGKMEGKRRGKGFVTDFV